MASPVGPVASVSQRHAHNAGGSMAVSVSSVSHPSYVLTGPFPFIAARVAPIVLCIQFGQITNPQAVWCYKILLA